MGRCLLLPYPREYLARVASAELPVNLAFTARGVPFVGPAAGGPSNEKCHAFKATRWGLREIVDMMIQTLTGLRPSATLLYAWLLKKRSS